jgi:uncharacterized protein (TIGR02145 family)
MKDSISGTSVYQETHSVEVNSYGLINLAIGTGTVISGTFSEIGWDTSEHYLKVEIDPDAGSNYFDFGTTQLISVPYSLESKHASSLTLTGEDGNRYNIEVDTSGNVITEWLCGNSLIDTRDGKFYLTVLIGTQCWMAENLNVGTKINSTAGGYQQTDNDTIEKYCYNNDVANCAIYGGLYEWTEAMQYLTTEGAQGICPNGWHIPTDGEWTILTNFLGGESVAGGKMKSTGTIEAGTGLWYSPNTGATNESGFTGLPAGFRHFSNGYFGTLGFYGRFWSSSQYLMYYAWYRSLDYSYANVTRSYYSKVYGFSVRCLKDD